MVAAATDQQIVRLLGKTGHITAPFGEPATITKPYAEMRLTDQVVINAVKSYQSFNGHAAAELVAAEYPDRLSPALKVDGIVGPAMRALFQIPRCECPDHSPAHEKAERLQGSGNWAGCHGHDHAAVAKFTTPIPKFLRPYWDEIWEAVVNAFAEVGLLWIRDDDHPRPDTKISFVRPNGSWIGLATVTNRARCGSNIFARFDKNWRPSDIVREWITLWLHELGHNCGLSHHRLGGIMAPILQRGLAPTFIGDPSEGLMKTRFGGVPVPRDNNPGDRRMVLAWESAGGKLTKISNLPAAGESFWPGA